MPPGDLPPNGTPDMIAHAGLTVGDHLLMGSDDPTGSFKGMRDTMVSHTADDTAGAERVFAALAERGETIMPLAEVPWSPLFGMCVDRFGIRWMVDTTPVDV